MWSSVGDLIPAKLPLPGVTPRSRCCPSVDTSWPAHTSEAVSFRLCARRHTAVPSKTQGCEKRDPDSLGHPPASHADGRRWCALLGQAKRGGKTHHSARPRQGLPVELGDTANVASLPDTDPRHPTAPLRGGMSCRVGLRKRAVFQASAGQAPLLRTGRYAAVWSLSAASPRTREGGC